MSALHIERSNLKIGEHPTGLPLEVPVITLTGPADGPTVYIQANIHGAEIQGNAVIHHLLEAFKANPPAGKITLVPLANPIGINHKNGEFTLGRFDPVTGVNWNRQYHFDGALLDGFVAELTEASDEAIRQQFRAQLRAQINQRLDNPWGLTVGQNLCLRLQRMAVEADIVLDLHTGPVSARHLYVPSYTRERARHFNIPLNILMPSDFDGALDEACFSPWWQLSERFAAQGRALPVMVDAFTLELGSQEWLNVEDAKQDAAGILNYLQHQGLWSHCADPLPYTLTLQTQYACELSDYKALYSPSGGQVEFLAPLCEPVPAGQPLARLWHFNQLGLTPDNGLYQALALPCNAIPVLHFASASVQQGTELYKVLTNTFAL
ncbi:succinylglutamate desuccinylase/aspartoacylase domain-containing protein [Ferrimonas pelagia]|uniref:M14 family metallopeptidase n=1 Tax=Ferrimonas pelagia TaxID=1177826 RepID=A0ABP9EB64_9GAMM